MKRRRIIDLRIKIYDLRMEKKEKLVVWSPILRVVDPEGKWKIVEKIESGK